MASTLNTLSPFTVVASKGGKVIHTMPCMDNPTDEEVWEIAQAVGADTIVARGGKQHEEYCLGHSQDYLQ